MNFKLQKAIEERPTLTIIKNTNEKTKIEFDKLPKVKKFIENFDVPESFDGRVVWKGLLTTPKNQGKCGSCWAFASTSTLADRFNIQSAGLLNIDLSPTKLILCAWGKNQEWEIVSKHPETDISLDTEITTRYVNKLGCRGNTLLDAWRFLFIFGTPTEECVPYDKQFKTDIEISSFKNYQNIYNIPSCTLISGPLGDMCSNIRFDKQSKFEFGTPSQTFRCIHIYSIAGTPEDGGSEFFIRSNIFQWGPVSTGMVVYPDFYTFDAKNDIYEWNGKGEPVGGHAIEIVGWGEKNNKKYWIIKNSWGTEWGRNGYFYMIRGKNNCLIEENIITGIPDFFYPLDNYYTNDPQKNIIQWTENIDKDINKQRSLFETDFSIMGGGIDPETGYSRRVMINKPWLLYKRPIDLDKLPDWHNFIAGINANKFSKKKLNLADTNFSLFLNLSIIYIIIFLILFLLYLKIKK